MEKSNEYGILLPKLFWPTERKNCSSDQQKLLKFEAEQFSKQNTIFNHFNRAKNAISSWRMEV